MIYWFEDCSLDTRLRELRRAETLLPVEPQVFDLLYYLIQNRDRVVSRSDIFDAVWNGRIVSDATLATRINGARGAIGDNGREQRLIRTLRGKGLRFIGTVREEQKVVTTSSSQIVTEAGRRSTLLDRPAIAVLPFMNVSGDLKQDQFTDGLTEDLISALSKIDWLFVASRNSSFAYKGKSIEIGHAARQLGVRYILNGNLRLIAGRMRVIAQLTDSATNRQVWTERYDGNTRNPFSVQDHITRQILVAIEPQLYLAERIRAECASPEELNAWECIVRALSLMNSRTRENVEFAHGLLQRAIILDPKCSKAHSLLSFLASVRLHQGWVRRQTTVPNALSLAHEGLSRDPDEPWAHLALGYALIWKHPEEAIRPLENALALNPKLAVGHYLHALASTRAGLSHGVVERAELATTLSPQDLLAQGNAGVFNNVRASWSFAGGRYGDGIEFARKAISESPRLAPAHRQLVANYSLAGKLHEAKAALQTLRHLAPGLSLGWIKVDWNWSRDEDQKKYVEAFRIAGLK